MPGKVLEADREEIFEVVVPGADGVAVGCEDLGWQELTAVAADAVGADASTRAAAVIGVTAAGGRPSSTSSDSSASAGKSGSNSREGRAPLVGLFNGAVVLPRSERCYVAARSAAAVALQGEAKWTPIISLQVGPQVSCVLWSAGR
jgi:hypothetical protein